LIVELVGHGKRVLDIGCATGDLAEVLAERGCEVTGIEIDPEAARQAEERCERVTVGDVERLDLGAELDEESFDVIIFGDILEHLKDPLRTLKRLKSFLRAEGYAVASIPNVAHGSVRLALLQGEFEYRPLGLLDDTHLRFFTRDSIEKLFRDAGYIIDIVERTRLGLFDTEISIDKSQIPEKVLDLIGQDPEATTYQFVLTAHPQAAAQRAAKSDERTQYLEEQLAQRDRLIHELNRELRNMAELERQLRERNNRLAQLERTNMRLSNELELLRRKDR